MNIAELLKQEIDNYCQTTYNDGYRSHLGASQIGHECSRHLWYQFRWSHNDAHSGRMYRLFQRGHLEESRIIEYLRGVGIKVWQYDPDTNTQIRISDIQGHFGGSCDGVAKLPEQYNHSAPVLLEFKTSSTGKSFDDLAQGVRQARPQHYAQMCIYGKYLDLTHALYITVNKNDDDLYIEFVELDRNYADLLTDKAEHIIRSPTPPSRLSQHPTYYKCKWCSSHNVCHKGKALDINCRTCVSAITADKGTWYCSRYDQIISPEVMATGCNKYEQIDEKKRQL